MVSDTLMDPAVSVSVQSLLDERHTARESTLHQPAGSGQWTGNFRGARRGHGTDFDDLRHYSAGDELRHIDWKASARTNTLHTRLYREEREHRVTLLTDLRRSMFTGTRALRSATACHLTARLLWQAIESGSRVCVIGIADAGLAVSENGGGHRAAIDACALLARRFEAARQQTDTTDLPSRATENSPSTDPAVSAGTAGTAGSDHTDRAAADTLATSAYADTHPDALISPTSADTTITNAAITLEQVAHWLSAQRQLHGSVIWVSAFDQLGQHFDEAMNALSQATRQVAIHVNDEMLERGLPAGHYGYRSGTSTEKTRRIATLSRKQVEQLKQHLSQQKQQRIKRFAELLIPLLNSDSGNTDIVATLRQSGHLP